MKNIFKSRQNGFAIIEALIAFLLLGIGVAALLYLQGNLMSGSSTSKARAEAMELAKDRTEVLRNYVDRDQYLSALGSLGSVSDNPVGVNATYTVSYTLLQNNDDDPPALSVIDGSNPLTTDKAQNLAVTVNWSGSEGNAEEVSLETMFYYMSPLISSGIESGDGSGDDFPPLRSPLISGVEKRHDSTKSQELSGTATDEHRVMIVDTDSNISFIPVEVDVKTYTNPLSGRSNVEVVVGTNPDGSDNVVLTSFGGIVHKIEGDIIVDPGATSTVSDLTKKGNTLLGLFASPPSYCLFSICEEAADFDPTTNVCEKSNRAEFASYVCYVPGDCTYGSVDSTGAYDTRCPDPTGTLPFKPPPGFDDLNGGWYGRVGNFNVELPQDMVCTADTNLSNTDTRKTPSREFATHRWELRDPADPTSDKFIAGNEGFNRPIVFQTFIIANKDNKEGACLELAKDYDAYERNPNCELLPLSDPPPDISTLTPIGTLMLPPANIIRWVGEGSAIPTNAGEALPDIWDNIVLPMPTTDLYNINVVLPTYTKYCGFVPF